MKTSNLSVIFLTALTMVVALPLRAEEQEQPSPAVTNDAPRTIEAPAPQPGTDPEADPEEKPDPVDPKPQPDPIGPETVGPKPRPLEEETAWDALGKDPELELVLRTVPLPGDDIFDMPYGFEIAVQSWIDERFGGRLSIGYQRWSVGEESLNYYGVAQVIPIGIGLMIAIPEDSNLWDLRCDLGISLGLVSGDLSYGGVELDYGSSIGGQVGLTADLMMLEDWPILLSVGYQLDISASQPSDIDINADFEQQGFYLGIGIRRYL